MGPHRRCLEGRAPFPPPDLPSSPPSGVCLLLPFRLRRLARALACLLSLGILYTGVAQAAPVTAECPTTTTRTPGNRIECTKGSGSTDDIDIELEGVKITTEDDNENGIKATHAGTADIIIDVTGTSTDNTISTMGDGSEGIHGKHTGTGDVDIDVEAVTITTTGERADGIEGEHTGTGNVDIDLKGVSVSTMGGTTTAPTTTGVKVEHTGTGDITINVQGKTDGTTTTRSTIATTFEQSRGIFARQDPATGKMGGDVDITVRDTKITTSGDSA